jgi:hypothetical protein
MKYKYNLVQAYTCAISGFRRDVGEICALLGYYAALSSSVFKGQRVQDFLTLEDGTDRLSRNVGTKVTLNAA